MKPVSIILIFRNEQLVVLLRTLHSLVDRTPKNLFSELILVNDYSDMDFWKDKLSLFLFDNYVLKYIHPKARIIHLTEHIGIIQSVCWQKTFNFPAALRRLSSSTSPAWWTSTSICIWSCAIKLVVVVVSFQLFCEWSSSRLSFAPFLVSAG